MFEFTTALMFLALTGGPLLAAPGVEGLSTVVVAPENDQEIEVGLVVIPGAELRGESYLPLAQSIQAESPLKLWVALTTDYINDTPNPFELSRAIDIALEELWTAGMNVNSPIFFAGHSLGGTFLQTYINNRRPSTTRGMMLWGSYLTGGTGDLAAYPTPVMHLSGDLDGQVRITRLQRTFSELEAMVAEDGRAAATKPVVVVEGVNHFQFSSGDPPPLVEREDIPSDVTAEEAWSKLAIVIKDFLSYNVGVDSAASLLRLNANFQETQAKMAPLTAAKEMEWNGIESPWLIKTQELVAAFPDPMQTPITIYNVGYDDQSEFESSKPSIVMDSDGMAIIVTRSKPEYRPNPIDISGIMESADEIAGKMKNQAAVTQIIKEEGFGDSAICRQINEAAYNYAFTIAPEVVRSRFESRGYPMIFAPDVNTSTGSEWVSSHVTYETGTDGSLLVTASALYTNVDFPVGNLAGMYYCKMMSPYRALEWMYVDSLRPLQQE